MLTRNRKIPSKIKNNDLVNKRREQIFQATSKLIRKKGFHKTTMRDISKESGIGLGNLYDYIRKKEDILYLFHSRVAQIITDEMQRTEEETGGPIQKLIRLIESELETRDRYQDLIITIYQESHALSKPSLKSLLLNEEANMERYQQVIKEGIEMGVIKQGNPIMLANLIKMMIDCWILRRWTLRGKVNLDEMKKGVVGLVQDGIIIRANKSNSRA
jgi:AcrR family transcriptional regulator